MSHGTNHGHKMGTVMTRTYSSAEVAKVGEHLRKLEALHDRYGEVACDVLCTAVTVIVVLVGNASYRAHVKSSRKKRFGQIRSEAEVSTEEGASGEGGMMDFIKHSLEVPALG